MKLLKAWILVVTMTVSPTVLAQPESSPKPPPPANDNSNLPGWLGVWVQPLTPALKSQLASLLSHDEGLLVTEVEPGSPAHSSGIRPYDVMVSFGGQKLYSPRQLASLVRNFNANSEVEIVVVQQGQLQTLNPTLRADKRRMLAKTRRPPHPYPPRWRRPPAPPPAWNDSNDWKHFEQIKVKTLADGRYRAEVSYRDNGESNSFTFEGDREEIETQIRSLDSLPPNKKRALLRALNLRPGHLPELGHLDGLLDDLWNSPLFGPALRDRRVRPDRLYPGPWQDYPPWQLHLHPNWRGRYDRP